MIRAGGEYRRRGWLYAGAAYLALTLLYFWPLFPTMGTALPSDLGDPALNSFILWWNVQAVPLTAEWWNAPMFYPQTGTFALSETLIGLTPVTTPLQWLGATPAFAHNAVLIASYPAAALAAHALAYRLTGRHDASFIAGVAFGFSPSRAAQISHLQMMISFWLPLGLLALHTYVQDGRARWAALAGVCWMGAGLATGYFLLFFAVLIGCWMFWFARRRRDWIGAMTAFALAALLMAPLLVAYTRQQSALGLSRGIGEIETFSADLAGVWSATRRGDLLSSNWTFEPGPEGELYPGAIILVLTLIGVVAATRTRSPGGPTRIRRALVIGGLLAATAALLSWWLGGWQIGPISINRPQGPVNVAVWLLFAAAVLDSRIIAGAKRRSPFLFYVLASGAMLLLALGPFPRVFGERFMSQAPYGWLMQLPGGDALRVPARFGILFMLCLGQAAAIAFARLTPRGAARGLAPALGVLIALEGYMPALEILKVVPPLEHAGIPDDAILLELPLDHHASDPKAMLRATGHRLPLINGYSGYQAPHYPLLAEGLRDRIEPDVMKALQTFGPIYVLVSRTEGVFEQYRDLMDAYPDAKRVSQTPAGILYRLVDQPRQPRDDAAPLLPIAEIEVMSRQGNAPLMRDGDIMTRWETLGRQSAGDQVIVRFDASATFARIEMDLGKWHGDYPRGLRIDVAPDRDAPGVTVWHESMMGETILGLLDDHTRTPLVVDLPPGVTGRELRLTTTTGHDEMSWSIAELRVFGRR